MSISVDLKYICDADQCYLLHFILNYCLFYFLIQALECISYELGITWSPILLEVIQEILRYSSDEIILILAKSMYFNKQWLQLIEIHIITV